MEVEDLYRPYKEKKKTKATEAIAKGLEPLAKFLLSFPKTDVLEEANKYLNDEVLTTKDALEGAGFIISELVSDDANYRKYLRDYLFRHGVLISNLRKNGKELDVKGVYEIYYDYSQSITKIKPHQILAINRAEDEKVITVKLDGTSLPNL